MGCATSEESSCNEAAEELGECLGDAAEDFAALCTEQPMQARIVVESRCGNGKADWQWEWYRNWLTGHKHNLGEECWWYDEECNQETGDGKLVCRPRSNEGPLFCLRPGVSFCDDVTDCASGLECKGKNIVSYGMCVAPEHPTEYATGACRATYGTQLY